MATLHACSNSVAAWLLSILSWCLIACCSHAALTWCHTYSTLTVLTLALLSWCLIACCSHAALTCMMPHSTLTVLPLALLSWCLIACCSHAALTWTHCSNLGPPLKGAWQHPVAFRIPNWTPLLAVAVWAGCPTAALSSAIIAAVWLSPVCTQT
jgi:hypothetical protein